MQLKCNESEKIMNEIKYTHFNWMTLWLENWIPFALFWPSHPTCMKRNSFKMKIFKLILNKEKIIYND